MSRVEKFGGRMALIVRQWTDECIELSRRYPVVLNYARGWKGDDVSFLSGLMIRDLTIIGDSRIKGLAVLQSLGCLERLSLSCVPAEKVDLGGIVADEVWIDEPKNFPSVLRNKNIRKFGLSGLEGDDLSRLGEMTSVSCLKIKGCSARALSGIQTLQDLRLLDIQGAPALSDISGLVRLPRLETVILSGCGHLSDVRPLADVATLREMALVDLPVIQTITGWERLTALRKLSLEGSTKIADGNLDPLEKLSKHAAINFVNRPGYTHIRGIFGGLKRRR